MASIVWYHGGPRLTDLRTLKWDRDRNVDQNANGPGLYWTTDREESQKYGQYHYRGTTNAGWRFMPNRPATAAFVKSLFDAASKERREAFLENWIDQTVTQALQNYVRHNTMLDASVLLYHDLFSYDADEYVRAIRTLYDGVIVSFPKTTFSAARKHLICWSPEKMTFKDFV